jgi:hypothetical protein
VSERTTAMIGRKIINAKRWIAPSRKATTRDVA